MHAALKPDNKRAYSIPIILGAKAPKGRTYRSARRFQPDDGEETR